VTDLEGYLNAPKGSCISVCELTYLSLGRIKDLSTHSGLSDHVNRSRLGILALWKEVATAPVLPVDLAPVNFSPVNNPLTMCCERCVGTPRNAEGTPC
jgi:hypothetical protein